MISKPEPFSSTWRGIPMEETHKYELRIECILNNQLLPYNMRSKRVEEDPYSDYDIGVYNFNLKTLSWGTEICKIDLERKKGTIFPKNKCPDHWNRGASFAARKVEKLHNFERDVYVLFDCREYPRIIWVPYQHIREFGVYFQWGSNFHNRFYSLKDPLVCYGYHSLVKWCTDLKNSEVSV